jgi:Ca2+:H+ antiporter
MVSSAPALGSGFRIKPFYWLLLAVPLAITLELLHASPLWTFAASGLAIIPLAGLMGRATECLAETLGAGIGGLLNATFGNAAELIIALVALSKGPHMHDLVKASITGSIIGNVLLVLGLSVLAGGLKYPRQTFNRTAAGMGATLLALASIGLIIPTIYYYLSRGAANAEPPNVEIISEEISFLLALTYALSLVFSLRTHSHLFDGAKDAAISDVSPTPHPEWSRRTSLMVLTGSTALVALLSEFLVGSVEGARQALGMSEVFVGVIVVAVIGNAAEHSTAVLMAYKNKMDLAVHIAIGSSMQVALLVAPVLVFASLLMGQQPILDLHFTLLEVIAVIISIWILSLVSQDGESHWMEGVMMLVVYAMLALAFYHLPAGT